MRSHCPLYSLCDRDPICLIADECPSNHFEVSLVIPKGFLCMLTHVDRSGPLCTPPDLPLALYPHLICPLPVKSLGKPPHHHHSQ